MALPTVPSYWTTRRNVYEQAIVKHRNHETDFRDKWTTHADYFQKSNISATKKQSWESEKSFNDSLDAYKSEQEKGLKALNLKRRRLKLAELLQRERDEYEAELKGYSRENYSRMEDMKDRVETLRSAREEKRKNLAEEKLFEHWRVNNPDLRKIEQQQSEKYVIDKWEGQIEDRQRAEELARQEQEEYELQQERERRAAAQHERQREADKLREEKNLKIILRNQMIELKERETQAGILKKQQDALQQQQWELARLEEERKMKEENKSKQEMSRFLLRQHKAQMMRKSRKIQEELEEDRRFLEAMLEREKEDQMIQTARREKAHADATWMKEVIEDQLRLEKAREAELEMLYQDEAARMWQKRDAEWEKERRARERLMNEVIQDRQQQIGEKMEVVRLQQEESLQHREQLLREMEVANQLTQRDQKEAEAQKEALKLDLKEQMTSRRDREVSARQRLEEELAAEKEEEKQYDEFLQQETERMKIKEFTPRYHGRRTAWM
ncbi:hypothetical protein ScPMuIL_006022 [Solemya velum]